MARMTIREAAINLKLAEVTVRRRLRSGIIKGYQENPPSGQWWVELEDQEPSGSDAVENGTPVLFAMLQAQLEAKDAQIRELHILLQQAQEQANRLLPPPPQRRWWWPFP